MPSIVRGSIVWAALRGPDGELILDSDENPKERTAVVLSNAEDIASGRPLVVAAISTQFNLASLPSHWHKVPSQPGGHPDTGLDQPCVVNADWLAKIEQNDIDTSRVSPQPLSSSIVRQILNWLRQRRADSEAES